jgi:hypothetical protein
LRSSMLHRLAVSRAGLYRPPSGESGPRPVSNNPAFLAALVETEETVPPATA